MENMDSQGELDTDTFGRALLEYRNTPNPATRLSPAQVVFAEMSEISYLSSLTSTNLARSGAYCRRIGRGHLLKSCTMTGQSWP